jgi:hypothetical protein
VNTCPVCGERMRYLGRGLLMCPKLYDLALSRHLAGDARAVTHESLSDDPLIMLEDASGRPRA